MATATWDSFKIQLPGKDFLEPVRDVLQTLLVFLEVLKAILETVKAFLIDFPNPIAALVQALIALVNTFFLAINRSGLYAWFDVPNPSLDPHYFRFQGGFPAFVTRFKAGLLDSRDPNRPQPISGATQSGFICIVCDAQGPIELLRLIGILLRFFQKDLLHPQYPAPGNVKILPVGSKNDPILNLARVFELEIKGILLSWTLGGQISTPDPGFRDLGSIVSREFIPPNWLIEKSSIPVTGKISSDDLTKPGVAGNVMQEIETDHEIRGAPGKRGKQTVHLTDKLGNPIVRFEKVIPIKTGLAPTSGESVRSEPLALIGELGVFKYPDTEVEFDKTYFYRIRAYTGDLPISDGVIQYKLEFDPQRKRKIATLPNDVVLGKPSQVHRVRLPKIPPKFNVIEELTRIFLTAFSLNFHLDPELDVKFDSNDDPIGDTSVSQIGVGSLSSQASFLAQFKADPFAGRIIQAGGKITSALVPPVDPVTDQPEPPPWNEPKVRFMARRMAAIIGSALLEQGTGAISSFQQILLTYPKGPPSDVPELSGAANVSAMCHTITAINAEGNVDQAVFATYGKAFTSPLVRKNVLAVVRFLKSFTLGGTPPDWIQVSILRDIIPWSGALLYEILAKIQALLDAFKSVMDEITNFIDMLERKIDVLEKFIQFLLNILDFILSLSAGFYVLRLPSTGGDIFSWLEAIDNAGGTKPSSGPGGYSCGVSFAYIAPDITAFTTALGLIF